MSIKHPIIAVTGSSGAGTSTVLQSFRHIFRREKLTAQIIEGDSFHRYDRMAMRAMMKEQEALGNRHFSHFGPEANMLGELEQLFVSYGEKGTGSSRKYLHDAEEAKPYGQEPGTFTPWTDLPEGSDMLFYEGLHGAYADDKISVASKVDLLIGVVPIINLEWIQKLHRDQKMRGYSRRQWSTPCCAGCRTTSITCARSFRVPTSTSSACRPSIPPIPLSPAIFRRLMKAWW